MRGNPMQEFSDRPERVLRVEAVCKRIGYGKSKLYSMLNTGEFPPGIALGPKRVGWRESQVDAWIKSRPIVDLRKPAAKPVADIAA